MNKSEYMNALKQSLDGLPTAVVEETMWAYESKFIDALMAGRSEEQVAASLPSPQLVAAQQRSKARLDAFKHRASPANLAALLVALLGVMVFNLFMIIPAIVYVSMLVAAYVTSLSFYVAGIAIAAGGMSGVEHFKFDMPSHNHHVVIIDDHDLKFHGRNNVTVDITPVGINIEDGDTESSDSVEPLASTSSKTTTNNPVNSASSVVANSASSAVASNTLGASTIAIESKAKQGGIQVNVDNGLNRYHVLQGIGFLLGGIALFMLCLFMTKYTFIGFKNYLQWNMSLLRLPTHANA